MSEWTTEDIPDLSGRVIIVTGGNSGLGYESVKAVAHKGATEPGLLGDEFFGPGGWLQRKGPAVRLDYPRTGRDMEMAKKLWERSMALTGEDYGGL